MFGSLAKAVLEPRDAGSIADVTAEAVALSMAGRPGTGRRGAAARSDRDPELDAACRAGSAAETRPSPVLTLRQSPSAAELFGKAGRPLIVAGELVAQQAASDALTAFAEACGAPVMAAYRRQDVMDNRHPAYAGHLEINRMPFQREAFAAADLIVAVGSRLDGITTEDGTLIGADQPFRSRSTRTPPCWQRSRCTLPDLGRRGAGAELKSPLPP